MSICVLDIWLIDLFIDWLIAFRRFRVLERGSRDGYSTAVVEFLFDLVPEGESLVGRFFSFIFYNSYLTRAGNYWILKIPFAVSLHFSFSTRVRLHCGLSNKDQINLQINKRCRCSIELPSSSNSKTAWREPVCLCVCFHLFVFTCCDLARLHLLHKTCWVGSGFFLPVGVG